MNIQNKSQPNNKRPKHLNLVKIKMPVSAVVSILHRVSGIILFLSIPYVVWLFSTSVRSVYGYTEALTILNSGYGKLASILLLWAITHHFYAGLRFLILDLDIGISREATLKVAWLVQILVLITFAFLIYKVVL